jgi:hypothetical protein
LRSTTFRSSSPISRGRSPSIRPHDHGATALQGRRRLARLRRPAGAFDPRGSFRTGNIDNDDCHFAFRIDDFDGALATLTANGFREDAAEDDPMRVMVRRNGLAGFLQLYLLDPDRNIIETNGTP